MPEYCKMMKNLRLYYCYKQSEVAEHLGITQQLYSKYECGEVELPIRHLIMLSQFYGVTADYILGTQFERSQLWQNI